MINQSKMVWLFTLILYLLVSSNQLKAFELIEADNDDVAGNAFVLRGWEEDNVSYMTITNNFPSGIASQDWTDVVTDSFQAWTDITSSTINLIYNGDIALTDVNDANSYYTVRYPDAGVGSPDDTGANMVVSCIDDWETAGFPSNALAVTTYLANPETRYFLVADMFMNCDPASGFSWAIGAVADAYDLQSVVTHEAGHFIGIGHPYNTGRETSTMWYMGTPNDIEAQTLEPDDENAAIYLYPASTTLVTTPAVIPPDNNLYGLRDNDTGEWTDDGPAIDPDNDPLVNGSGGGGGCSLSAKDINSGAWVMPYALLFLVIISSRMNIQFARNRRF